MPMKAPLEKTEHFVDKAIPYLILVLFFIVIIDIFFRTVAETYHSVLFAFDSVIITFFVVDLAFKYNRVRNVPRFLRLYWLDILAVLPFLLLLRVFEEVLLISERSVSALRNLFHVGVVIEEEILAGQEAERLAKTSEVLAKEGRVGLISKWFQPLRRLPRLLKAISFFEHPSKRKILYHKT